MSDIADPSRHLVLTVDVERYSGRDNVLQWRVQQALPRIMRRAREELGLLPDGWLVQPSGDGQLAILPQGTSERTIVTRLAPTVDRLLREHNHGLAPEARIRLRIGVHEGLVHLDGDNGFPGEAVVTACRLVDSPQLKATLRRFPEAQVALIVSDRLYQDVVRHYGDLRPEHFLRVTASLPEKSFDAVAWIHLPGENAAAEQPSPATTPVQPSAGGQTFQHITAHGPTAFGNGNVITTYGSAGSATPHRP
ncbi:hypothetical protein AB0B63_08530 [Micromonospora sp. NPDC049081]|uniref:hypothetical protein n=1 Tax=Micromonospora sp. NPDC049081 TaxID=3155150 RepID=UPI0033F84BF1